MTPSHPIDPMVSIRAAGYCVGGTRIFEGHFVASAVHSQSFESFTVTAEDERSAWIELARQLGVEIEIR